MTVTSPAALLQEVDEAFFRAYKGLHPDSFATVTYVEPRTQVDKIEADAANGGPETSVEAQPADNNSIITSTVITLGDFVDTDALSPGFTLTSCKTDEEFGQHVLELTYPEFRSKVAAGQRVVVGGHAFGVGSSRESAVSALKGAGVQAVIARSFAFIYSRNQPSLGLPGIVMSDEEFYSAAGEGAEVEIDLARRTVSVDGRSFPFQLSDIEYELTRNKGIAQSYKRYGKAIWEKMTSGKTTPKIEKQEPVAHGGIDDRLTW